MEQAFVDPLLKPVQQTHLSSVTYNRKEIHNKILQMVNDFQTYGHYVSKVDPLGKDFNKQGFYKIDKFNNLDSYEFSEEIKDLELDFEFPLKSSSVKTPRQLFQKLRNLYTGKISFQFKHIKNNEVMSWIENEIQHL